MHVKRSRRRLRAAMPHLLSASLLCVASVARADLWDNSDNNNLWSDANDWADNSVPTINDPVILPSPIVGTGTITMVGAETAASLTVNDNYTLSGNSATLQVGSSTGTITVAGTKILTLSTALVANAVPLAVNGAGTMAMNNASSRTGSTTITNGAVRLNNAASLGTGTIHASSNGWLEIVGGVPSSNSRHAEKLPGQGRSGIHEPVVARTLPSSTPAS